MKTQQLFMYPTTTMAKSRVSPPIPSSTSIYTTYIQTTPLYYPSGTAKLVVLHQKGGGMNDYYKLERYLT